MRAAAAVLRRCLVMGRAGGVMAWGRVQKVKVAAAESGWVRGEEWRRGYEVWGRRGVHMLSRMATVRGGADPIDTYIGERRVRP